jgi:hypothetical protein
MLVPTSSNDVVPASGRVAFLVGAGVPAAGGAAVESVAAVSLDMEGAALWDGVAGEVSAARRVSAPTARAAELDPLCAPQPASAAVKQQITSRPAGVVWLRTFARALIVIDPSPKCVRQSEATPR